MLGSVKQYCKEFTHNAIVHPLMMILPTKWASALHDSNADWAFAARMDELALEGYRPEVTPSTLSASVTQLIEGLRKDEGYAWSWHCNLAMAAFDSGVPHKKANESAARFMQVFAGVDTTKFLEYAILERQWEAETEGTEL